MKPVLNETGDFKGGFYYGVVVHNCKVGKQAGCLFFYVRSFRDAGPGK